ncbi:hypothetical protein L207DRAFT_346675 [Hyaloscypha variabilis F]|uniref:Uncharacterized protein n=1 Tax=Hyaloscypha variabilis (strain UAMH 11265 / GT02V1 / F) TaxID=1149755 RepID=A0A2J6RQR0_HYAVF|nr:hypothetical protein L207DRAFT_346675 [Hyaloscypha variabilis F]
MTYTIYPGLWSEWAWSEQYHRYYRARLKGKDEYEYEYGEATNPRPQGGEYQSLAAPLQITECSEEKTFSLPLHNIGTYPSIDSVAAYPSSGSNVAATLSASISTYGEQDYAPASPMMGWQNHIRTRDPYTDREEFDPRPRTLGL